MKKLLVLMVAAFMAVGMMAQEKFSFVIQGSEDTYNQVRVINRTSLMDLRCRVVAIILYDKNSEFSSEF